MMKILKIKHIDDFFKALQQQATSVQCRSTELSLPVLVAINPFLTQFGQNSLWEIPATIIQKAKEINLLNLIIIDCYSRNKNVFKYLQNLQFHTQFCSLENVKFDLHVLLNFQQVKKLVLTNCTLLNDETIQELQELTLKSCKSVQKLNKLLINAQSLNINSNIIQYALNHNSLISVVAQNIDFCPFLLQNVVFLDLSSVSLPREIVLPYLQKLALFDVSNLVVLANCPALRWVSITHSAVQRLELPGSLVFADLQSNELTHFSLQGLQHITALNLSVNPLSSLQLASGHLKQLYLDECQIVDLDQMEIPNLELLSVQRNEIQNIWQVCKVRNYQKLVDFRADFQRNDIVFSLLPQIKLYNMQKQNSKINQNIVFINFQYNMYQRGKYNENDVDNARDLVQKETRVLEQYMIYKVISQVK
ncbi:hypothetical protein SS50377_25420 [Spironucleus salmonicida]|uniref:Uncharacterized protein n=1 Tax=Spironucleus salmonicida TaxID=348837 RepID=V6LK18_9EUKA|nr:hypothetical protein SS50377_25420 [Spironucleus salmonicida]|eukprot:EST44965.1 Hypothetical protein SS50377_14983 [Spironucleus salmonicida]